MFDNLIEEVRYCVEADNSAYLARKAEIVRKAQDRRNVKAGKPTSDQVAAQDKAAKAARYNKMKADDKAIRARMKSRRKAIRSGRMDSRGREIK
jgi:SHS2 domain-containing protein